MAKIVPIRPEIDSNAEASPFPDSALAVNLTVGQLRQLIRQEIEAASYSSHGGDRLLSAEETCPLLSVSTDWLYRHASKLPFTRKLGPKMLRFSYQGIQKWLATRKLS